MPFFLTFFVIRVRYLSANSVTRGRRFCFTLNNPEGELDIDSWGDSVRVCVYQNEVGEAGTPHHQGYVEFKKAYTLRMLKALNGMSGAHWENAKANREANRDYCTKDDGRQAGPFYWPDRETVEADLHPGKRTDIDGFVEEIKKRKTDEELLEGGFGVQLLRYGKGMDRVRNALPMIPFVERVKDCVMYFGETGTGKSYRLRQECPPGDTWFWASPGKWFDTYRGQPGIVFDEIRDSWYSFAYLLKLIENTPQMLEVKGGTVRKQAYMFRMSTNVHPKFWYKNARGDPNGTKVRTGWHDSPLRRRFSIIEKMSERVQVAGVMDVIDDDEPDWIDDVPEAVAAQYGVPQ